jgi:hypothetical protein
VTKLNQKQMKQIFQIHGLMYSIMGFLLIFNPQWLLYNPKPELQGIATAKLFGILAFSFGLLAFILSRSFTYTQAFKQIALVIIGYHFVVALFMYGLYSQNISFSLLPAVVHGAISIIFLIIYMNNMQKFPHDNA